MQYSVQADLCICDEKPGLGREWFFKALFAAWML
jgi:hypothetical protein